MDYCQSKQRLKYQHISRSYEQEEVKEYEETTDNQKTTITKIIKIQMMTMKTNMEMNNNQGKKIRDKKNKNATIHKDNRASTTGQANFKRIEIIE